ncbi:MAG TPA: AraC family transcriptional regulator [Acidobacteria bacterium]|nr:AraC family transcriptional regulator [Acidobacteriota bacterium]
MHLSVVLLSLLAGVAGGLLAAALYHRRQVASMRSLLQRLEELSQAAGQGEPPTGQGEQSPPATMSGVGTSLSVVTGDVLAGQTTHVKDLIEGGTVQGLPLADQAIVQIYARLEEPISASDLARSLNVSLRSLERGLSLALDCTPRELILAVKMREARRLLESGELNVTGVSYRLGFSSPSHFSRRFREFFKRPPSEVARRVA